jgi:hypothetical protein
MAENGSLPPVKFRRDFGKPPEQHKRKQKEHKPSPEDENSSFETEQKQRPTDPDNPPNIDLTA